MQTGWPGGHCDNPGEKSRGLGAKYEHWRWLEVIGSSALWKKRVNGVFLFCFDKLDVLRERNKNNTFHSSYATLQYQCENNKRAAWCLQSCCLCPMPCPLPDRTNSADANPPRTICVPWTSNFTSQNHLFIYWIGVLISTVPPSERLRWIKWHDPCTWLGDMHMESGG